MLASGGDDSTVLYWDLINAQNASQLPSTISNPSPTSADHAPSDEPVPMPANAKGPAASWRCDFEVGNLSWSPPSQLTSQNDWLGVTGGRAVWGVKM